MTGVQYTRIALLDQAEAIADERGMENPEGLQWGFKSVYPDLTTSRGYRWPFPGNWAQCPGNGAHIDTSNDAPYPSQPGDGICVGTSWRGMAQSRIPALTLLLVGWHTTDIIGEDDETKRLKKCYVRDVLNGSELVRRYGKAADLSGANLSGANLDGADLDGANLDGANLYGANLSRANLYEANLSEANLSRADLDGADLSGADLDGANLSGANLSRANLYGADLSGANLSGADLSGANLYGVNF